MLPCVAVPGLTFAQGAGLLGDMKRTRAIGLSAPLIALALLAGPAASGERANGAIEAACRSEAERLSGYRPPRLSTDVGGLHLELRGSVAVGVSKGGSGSSQSSPPFAGAASRERREAQQKAKYDDYLRKCLQRNFDAPLK